jgi:hypothetical protein
VAQRSWLLEKKEKRMEERNETCQEGMSKIKATNLEAWWRSNIKPVLQHFKAIAPSDLRFGQTFEGAQFIT